MPQIPRTPAEVIVFAKQNSIKMVDLKMIDMPGTWRHMTVPVAELTEELFANGVGFDGSSVPGFQTIDESDMLLAPDPNTAAVDPVPSTPTLSLICDVRDPISGGSYSRDPRHIAKKAETFLMDSGIGDSSRWGPEPEFFVFDTARFNQNTNEGFYHIDSDEGAWNSGNESNQGYLPGNQEGYYRTPPVDSQTDIRSEMVEKMGGFGIDIEKHHHEVGTAGQSEIVFRSDSLTRTADNVMILKYIVKNVAKMHGKTATFMPKPLFEVNGSGMHTHQSIWRGGENLFAGDGYAGTSEMMRHYIGGLLYHSPAIMALCAPTTNSYRRLVPGFEAPVNLAYSARNRSACCRIPMYSSDPGARRVEYRCPDGTSNPYLAFAAMLMAGVDGIINKIEPGDPLDVNIYNLTPEQAAKVKQVPGSLDEVLDALESNNEFLLRGGVFTSDLIETWINYKRAREVDGVRLRPHPYEFMLYYDA
jgi:glutamine synthetase